MTKKCEVCVVDSLLSREYEESWVDIEGYDGIYQVSSYGRVRSLDRTVTLKSGEKRRYRGRVLCSHAKGVDYPKVTLSKVGGLHTVTIHRLVAKAFLPNPKEHLYVNHKNSLKFCNSVCNLEWCTAAENTAHALSAGAKFGVSGSKNHSAKLRDSDIPFIVHWLSEGYTRNQVASCFGVSYDIISNIDKGVTWKQNRT